MKPVKLDITDEDAVHKFYSTVSSVNVLINNAGIGVFTPFEKLDWPKNTPKEFPSINGLQRYLASQLFFERY